LTERRGKLIQSQEGMGVGGGVEAAEGKIKGDGARPSQASVCTSDLVAHGPVARVQTISAKALI
jgi:hypothetical protein